MKKQLILSLLSLMYLVSSCSTSVVEEPEKAEYAIAFESPESDTRARAAIGAGDFPTDSSFKVWGGYYDNEGNLNATNIFNGEEIIYSDDKKWHYTGYPRFWERNKIYNFYAVYPNNALAEVSENGKIIVTGFDCSRTGDEAVDLMTASYTRITSSELNKDDVAAVSLAFRHELSRINLSLKSGNTVVSVSSFKLYGVNHYGNFTKEPDGSFSWEALEKSTIDNTPYKIEEAFVLNDLNSWEKNIFGDILLIPHVSETGIDDAMVYVEYYFQSDIVPRISTVSLKTSAIKSWEPGKSYNYVITVNGNTDIIIDVSVNEWTETNTSVSWE